MQLSLRGAIDGVANSRGRSMNHVLLGLALTGGAVALSAAITHLKTPAEPAYEAYSDYEDAAAPEPVAKPGVFAMLWPPLFMALTLSGLRIWNAPPSAARTQALSLWGMVQAFNAAWMTLGARRMGGQTVTVVSSLGMSLAYAWRARQVDPPAANMVAPYVGWIGLANVLGEELGRRR